MARIITFEKYDNDLEATQDQALDQKASSSIEKQQEARNKASPESDQSPTDYTKLNILHLACLIHNYQTALTEISGVIVQERAALRSGQSFNESQEADSEQITRLVEKAESYEKRTWRNLSGYVST